MVTSQNKTVLVGCHTSISGGLYRAIERGESIGCTALQLFTKSSRQWFEKKISEEDAQLFKQTWKNSTIQSIITHAGYLINVGSPTKKTSTQSTKSLLDEAHRCAQLGIKYLVLHPGSHLGKGVETCISLIAQNLDYAIEQSEGTVSIVLETMAGQGTNMGSSFEQLHEIRKQCTNKKHIAFCLDTCHIFAAGYNISTPESYKKTLTTFNDILGIEHLKAIHVNDSQEPFDSHKDRHAPLGEGHIPLSTFKCLMQDSTLTDVPKILETPTDPEMKLWAKEIALLKQFAQ